MMAVDTSAVVAVLEREEDAERYIAAFLEDETPLMSTATFVELSAVMWHRRGEASIGIVNRFIAVTQLMIEPLTHEQALLARDAYRRFRSLNLGDSYSYALAKARNIPLLFKGNDFIGTDVTPYL
jgi:ribonuclease VapC